MKNINRILFSAVLAVPAAVCTAIYPFKLLFRSNLQIGLILAASMVVFTAILAFWVIPSIRQKFFGYSRATRIGLIIFEIFTAVGLFYLIPFNVPQPDYGKLIITPGSGGRFELMELRSGNSVQNLNSASLEGHCRLNRELIAADDETCRVVFDIRRPAIKPETITLLFSSGPDYGSVNYKLERSNGSINLQEDSISERSAVIPSITPSQTVNLIVELIACLLAAQVFYLVGLALAQPPARKTDSAVNLLDSLADIWAAYKSFVLPVLCVYTLIPVAYAMVYPMEMEIRESTKWLHALALGSGVNVYQFDQTAFINMSHGPLDALIKSFLLPLHFPTLILRWAVLAFPVTIFLSAWTIIPGTRRQRLEHAALAAVFLELILITYRQVIITGQTETCAALFMVLTMVFADKTVTATRARPVFALLTGTTAICGFLSNWRYTPALAVISILLIVRLWLKQKSFKSVAGLLAYSVLGVLAIFAGLLGRYFDFNFLLYYNHFFGFYKDLGERLFLQDFLMTQNRGLTFVALFGLLILILIIRQLKNHEERIELTAWTAGLGFIILTTTVAFYLNGAGGGIHYYYPMFIYTWFLVLRYHNQLPYRDRLVAVTAYILLFTTGVGLSPIVPMLAMKNDWHKATITRQFLREVNSRTPIWSEDIHLFKDTWNGETVDMGEYDSFYRNSGLYPESFNALVDGHFAELRSNPPEVAITSIASSPQLLKFVAEKNYRKIGHFSGWYNVEFDIWERPDSEIRAPKDIQP